MTDFSKEIFEFRKTGEYNYKFDEGGNLIFKSGSNTFEQNYVSVPILNFKYNLKRINSFYDLNFTEFLPEKTETVENFSKEKIEELTKENEELKNKLNELERLTNYNISDSEKLATKQIILDLRIKLNQGKGDWDFSEEFPYLPKIRNT